MTEPTEKETKWFVNRLIDLRDAVDRYHSPITFCMNDLKEWEEENNYELSQDELYDRVNSMIEEMKSHYVEKNYNPLFTEKLKCTRIDEENVRIEGFTTNFLIEYKNWLNSSPENRRSVKIKPIEKVPTITFTTQDKEIELDLNNGDFKLGNVSGKIGVKTQEFKVLSCLMTNKGITVDYGTLCSCLGWENNITNRNRLTIVIRRIKNKMGILPENEAVNPDIFVNTTNEGYEIIEY